MCDSSPTLPNETKHERAKGLAIALFGVLSISPDALLVRFLSTHGADPWVIVFWKLLFSIPLTACWALVEAGGVKKLMNTITSGSRFYCMVVPVQSMIDIGFTLSFVYTSAAVALLLINLNPLWGAILGTFVLNDVMPIRTYIALALALVCIMIMFVPEMVIEVESNATSSLSGNVISLFTGFLCAVYLSIVRKAGQRDISVVGGTPFGAAISVILSAIKTRGRIFPGLFWDTDIWKFWLALLAQGFSIGIILVTEVSCL
jgi:drug/metabolite transporter (DMT)-like permease